MAISSLDLMGVDPARHGDPVAKAASHGEGSHGGHVIGHTRSGKPIYGDRSGDHCVYAGFTEADHGDALELHGHLHDYHRSAAGAAKAASPPHSDHLARTLMGIARGHAEQARDHDEKANSHFDLVHPGMKKPHPVLGAL